MALSVVAFSASAQDSPPEGTQAQENGGEVQVEDEESSDDEETSESEQDAPSRGDLDARLDVIRTQLSALDQVEVSGELAPSVALSSMKSRVEQGVLTAQLEVLEDEVPEVVEPEVVESEQELDPVADDVARVVELSQAAEVAFNRAVELENEARSEKLRELRAAERETAGKILDLTRTSRADLEHLREQSRELDARLAELAVEVRRAELGETAFPEPDSLREALVDIYADVRSVSRRHSEIRQDLTTKRQRLESVERSLEEFEGGRSEVRQRERAVLQTNLTYRELAIDLAEAELSALTSRLGELARHRSLFERGLMGSLETATQSQRRTVQGLSDAAVEFAGTVVSDRLRQARRLGREVPGLAEEAARGVSSVDFWVWIAGLFLSVLPLLFFLVFKRWIPALILKFSVFSRGFASARRNPQFVGRFFELLVAITRPTLNYVVIILILGYIESRFPQVAVLSRLVTAYFIYRIAVSAAETSRPLAERLENVDEEYHDAIVEFRRLAGESKWLSTELSRDIRSTVVEIFTVWLVVRTAQICVNEIFGFTLIDSIVNALVGFILVAVVLKNISQWREAIAGVFARVAPDRFSPTVEFVETHAQKFYGLFVVALALLYIVGHELVVFARRLIGSTAWFRALNRVVFRARFQRKIRDREGAELAPAPQGYLELFEGELSEAVSARLPRQTDERVDEFWTDWCERPRGGYVITALPGCGKSSELARLRARVDTRGDVESAALRLDGRMYRTDDFVRWLADALDLEIDAYDVDSAIDALNALGPHGFFVDDANRCFARAVEGYDGFEALTQIIRATAERHFWCIAFDLHAWQFVNYVSPRAHRFAGVVVLDSLELEETAALIRKRHAVSGFELKLDQDEDSANAPPDVDDDHEIAGFIRYIHEMTEGNLASSLALWRQSARLSGDAAIVMRLKQPPELPRGISDDGWFLLSALVQHGPLGLEDLSRIENEDEGVIAILMDVFVDHEVVRVSKDGEYSIRSSYYPGVVRQLVASNFLYGHS